MIFYQAKEEFHSQLAANRSQQPIQSNDLMDDNELLSDDRELDLDLVGKHINIKYLITRGMWLKCVCTGAEL